MRSVRRTLSVSVSTIALAAASSAALAADLPVKAPPVTPPPRDLWTWWFEGGAFRTEQDALFGLSAPLTGISPKWGWEAAVGFDYRMAAFSPYHLSGQFRYGAAKRSSGLFTRTESFFGHTSNGTPGSRSTSPIVGTGTGSGQVKEHHWLVDFAVGRDFALGTGMTQVKFGVRVAELYSKLTANEFFLGSFGPGSTTVSGNISFSNRSKFLGVGPRLGIDGSVPIGGSWSLDYLGGVAVLIGQRKLDATTSTAQLLYNGGPTTIILDSSSASSLSSSNTAAIFNLDAQLGISYWVTRTFKMTASYRFDGYFNALTTINQNGSTSNEDRFYHGPMLRATVLFGG